MSKFSSDDQLSNLHSPHPGFWVYRTSHRSPEIIFLEQSCLSDQNLILYSSEDFSSAHLPPLSRLHLLLLLQLFGCLFPQKQLSIVGRHWSIYRLKSQQPSFGYFCSSCSDSLTSQISLDGWLDLTVFCQFLNIHEAQW